MLSTVEKNTLFFRKNRIIDYSLLLIFRQGKGKGEGWGKGLRWHELGREIASVENEISFINGELDGLAADNPGRASLISTRSFLRLRLLRLEAQRARFRF